MSDWYERVASERMSVDSEFDARLSDSPLTNQQWGLAMTAVEFDIENPEVPERARIVPDTDAVEDILPAVREAGGRPGAAAGPDDASGTARGLLARLTSALGVGGSESDDRLAEAVERLTEEYARRLQETLENKGRWEEVCRRAAE